MDGQAATSRAHVKAFQRAMGLAESGQVDPQTEQRLADATGNQPALVEYEVREADVAGPFTPTIPADLVQQSKLKYLGYQNALEAIAERFHASPQLLKRLNGTATFSRAGERIQVPNVEPFELPQPVAAPAQRGRGRATRGDARGAAAPPAFTIAVTKSTSALTVEDATGRVVFHAPVTTGSEHDPLPIGTWKVTTVQVMPKFQLQPGPLLGRQPLALEGDDSGGAQQSRRRGVDRSQQGALRHPRHPRAVADRTRAIPRMRTTDQLGRTAGSDVGAAGNTGGVPRVATCGA